MAEQQFYIDGMGPPGLCMPMTISKCMRMKRKRRAWLAGYAAAQNTRIKIPLCLEILIPVNSISAFGMCVAELDETVGNIKEGGDNEVADGHDIETGPIPDISDEEEAWLKGGDFITKEFLEMMEAACTPVDELLESHVLWSPTHLENDFNAINTLGREWCITEGDDPTIPMPIKAISIKTRTPEAPPCAPPSKNVQGRWPGAESPNHQMTTTAELEEYALALLEDGNMSKEEICDALAQFGEEDCKNEDELWELFEAIDDIAKRILSGLA